MKKILKGLTLCLLVITLCGCVKFNINIEVKEDKTMNFGMEMLVEEKVFQEAGMTADEWVQQMQKEVMTSKNFDNIKVTPRTQTIDGTIWTGAYIEGNIDKDSKIILTQKEVNGKDSLVLTVPLSTIGNNSASPTGPYTYSSMMKGMEMKMIINMPNKATTNLGVADGNTVTVDLLALMEEGITEDLVVSSPCSTSIPTIVYIGIGLVVIVGIVVFMLRKKKTSHKEVVLDDNLSSQPQQLQIYCPNCGHEINENISVCPQCGFDINKEVNE